MRTIAIKNVSLFLDEFSLYVNTIDENLIRISGEEKSLLKLIIEQFQVSNNEDTVYNNLSSFFKNDHDYFKLCVDYLIEAEILTLEDNDESASKSILILGAFPSTISEVLNTIFNRSKISYNLLYEEEKDLLEFIKNSSPDMIICVSPFLMNLEKYIKVGDLAYNLCIPIFHVGLSNSNFVLGPIFDSNLLSPTLHDYIKRKVIALENPGKYLAVTKIHNKSVIAHLDLSNHPYFFTVMELLAIEIEKFLLQKKYVLVGKEIEFDMVSYNTKRSKILKTFNREIFL